MLALETSLSGPHATKILADMGAEVIKLERPGTGDVIRGWDTAVNGLSSGIVWIGPNKKSFAIDVKKPEAREILQRLAGTCDVVLENFAPGAAERMGLGAEELRAANPRLIYCSLSGYGQDGPYRDVKAYDALIQGEAGLIMTTGFEDRPGARRRFGDRSDLVDVCGGRDSDRAVSARADGRGPGHRHFHVRNRRVLARLFPASLLASRRRAEALWPAPPIHHALRTLSRRATANISELRWQAPPIGRFSAGT